MTVDRRALKILLAALEMEQQELAQRMGYDATYVSNIVNAFTEPSEVFKATFGELIAELVFGGGRRSALYPAQPLKEFVASRAADVANKTEFYVQLGLSRQGWNKRRHVSAATVDRVCCALGVHPSAIYGRDYEVAS